MTNEQKRRLDALESATNHIAYCEKDFKEYEAGSYEPFSVSPWTNVSGEVNVIYDRSGNVERIVRHDVAQLEVKSVDHSTGTITYGIDQDDSNFWSVVNFMGESK